MESLRHSPVNLPDFINCSNSKNYTMIPNDFIRNPKISSKAKVILSILLSNSNGWKSYFSDLKTKMKEGREAIQNGLQELTELKYVKRVKYRHIKTKKIIGTLWMYSDIPDNFNIKEQENFLRTQQYELVHPQTGFPSEGFPCSGFPSEGKPATKNNNIRITKENEYNDTEIFPKNNGKIIPPTLDMVKDYCKEKNSIIDPETFFNWNASKDWMIGKNKMVDWHCAIATWEKRNKTEIFTKQKNGITAKKYASQSIGMRQFDIEFTN